MIIPASPEELVNMTDAEVVAAYEGLGFSRAAAEAYTSVLRGGVEKSAEPLFMTIASAAELAEAAGHDELAAEVAKSRAARIGFIKLAVTDDGVVISRPNEVSVSLFVGDHEVRKATGGGDPYPDPRLVLARLGVAEEMSPAQTRKLVATVAEVAKRHSVLRGSTGDGMFAADNLDFGVELHLPGLAALRADLVKSLEGVGLTVEADEFEPVLPTARLGGPPTVSPEPHAIEFATLTTAVGSFRHDAELSTEESPVAKSVSASEERRFTLAPMYIPGRYDSQGDWADADDLQQALWKFSRGDKLIALQHHPEAGAQGEAVEMMVVPFEHTWPMTKSDGTSEMVTFPAGTPWLGVVWNEDVWPLVKAGKVRGYSIGGRASLLNVELPEEDVAKSLLREPGASPDAATAAGE